MLQPLALSLGKCLGESPFEAGHVTRTRQKPRWTRPGRMGQPVSCSDPEVFLASAVLVLLLRLEPKGESLPKAIPRPVLQAWGQTPVPRPI